MKLRFFAPFVFALTICVGGASRLLAGINDTNVNIAINTCPNILDNEIADLKTLLFNFLEADAYDDYTRSELMLFLHNKEAALQIYENDLKICVLPIADAKTDGKSVWIIDWIRD